MGFMKPKAPKVSSPPPPPEDPPGTETLPDPNELTQAENRAKDAERRRNRAKLRIPLSSSLGDLSGGAGIRIS